MGIRRFNGGLLRRRSHYAFKVREAEFDAIFGRMKADGVIHGSGPRSPEDMQINHRRGGGGVYFRDAVATFSRSLPFNWRLTEARF